MVTSAKKKLPAKMKVVILAGGFGTRISEETHSKPKPLVTIGERPILWHIMKIYSSYGFHDFIICLGYKGHYIKEYFANYVLHGSDVTFNLRKDNQRVIHRYSGEPWKVTLVDTGKETMTGGRIKQIAKHVENEPFMLTYGDGISDVNIHELVKYHFSHGKLATVTAVQPSDKFGVLQIGKKDRVTSFEEKPKEDERWINAGFLVMNPAIFDYIEGDHTVLEKEPLQNLARDGQLIAYRHSGFWHPIDTIHDKNHLDSLWKSGKALWKQW